MTGSDQRSAKMQHQHWVVAVTASSWLEHEHDPFVVIAEFRCSGPTIPSHTGNVQNRSTNVSSADIYKSHILSSTSPHLIHPCKVPKCFLSIGATLTIVAI